MKSELVDYKNVYYPPGGILIWLIIFLELITFGVALIALVFYSKEDPLLFHESRLQLNVAFGTINTVFLLTSGFFMAATVYELKENQKQKAQKYLLITMLFGVLFLILKGVEYHAKLNAGLDMSYNTFFSFYWMLTLFHVIHVLVGLVILISVYFGIRKEKSTTKMEDVEASAAFWHMCDIIWLLLFPVIFI